MVCYRNKPAKQAAGADLPDATPPIDKIHPFSKIAVTFEPVIQFWCSWGFRKFFITTT